MAKQTINIGSTANDGTGSTLRVGGDLINDNFNEIYTTFGNGSILTNPVSGKTEGTNFTGSLLVGHSTTGALSTATDNTGVGITALDALTTGDQNTALGTGSGTNITSSRYNTAIGASSLVNQTTGEINIGYNVAVGRSALQLTTGAYNVGVGGGAGENITSGSGNVIIGKVTADSATADKQLKIAGYDGTDTTTWIKGDSAGLLTITGGEVIPGKVEGTNFTGSVLVGHSTTGTLDAAQYNTGVGLASLNAITSGDHNVAVGYESSGSLTTGSSNTSIGRYAGEANQTSYYNTSVGYDALRRATGQANTAIGGLSGTNIAGGDYNITVGRSSGDNITTGSGNVVIGRADVSSATGDDQLSISDGEDGSVVWISGDSAGLLTITGGEVIPGKKEGTNFSNSLLVGHSTTGTLDAATYNVGVGLSALDAITSGDYNTVVGASALSSLTTSGYNTTVGALAHAQITTGNGGNTGVGFRADAYNQTGVQNTAIGQYAAYGAAGQSHGYNTAIGADSLKVLTTGNNNIGLGYQAGNNITSGSGNVVIGLADVSSATGDDQLSISDGEDGSVVWITGDNTGAVTMTLAANQITSTQLTGAVSLQILSSDGTVVKTLYGAGS